LKCGDVPPMIDRTFCALCNQRQRQWTKTWQSKFAPGMCVRCRVAPVVPGRVQCQRCLARVVWTVARISARKGGWSAMAMPCDEFVEWYVTRTAIQQGHCAWCGERPDPIHDRTALMADHDHVTGEVRALVCQPCNIAEGLGLERLEKVAAIIRSWGR
jgi:recombination endonuclease VII